MKIKKIFILIFSLFVLLTFSSCTGDVSIDYYEDPLGGKTITSTNLTDAVSTCETPDGYFTLTITAKSLNSKLDC